METTKKMKPLANKIEEAMSLMEDAIDCIKELDSEDYSERRGSVKMRGRYGRPSYDRDEMVDYDELPHYRRY